MEIEIVKFNSKDAEHEFHIEGAVVINEFRTYNGSRVKLSYTKRTPRKVYENTKGKYIKLNTGAAFGNKTKNHYIEIFKDNKPKEDANMTNQYKPIEKDFIDLLQAAEANKPLEIVQHRLGKIGFGSTCSKCNGSGHYLHFGVCYGCKGLGSFKIRLTKKLFAEVQEAVNEGALKRYFQAVRAQQLAKKVDGYLFNLMNNNSLSEDYSKAYQDKDQDTIDRLLPMRTEQIGIYEDFKKRSKGLDAKGKLELFEEINTKLEAIIGEYEELKKSC